MTSPSLPICYGCKNYIREEGLHFKCKAFGDDVGGIPADIIEGKNDHSKPYEGDNGIQFEPVEEK
jgi:hypothetical protein